MIASVKYTIALDGLLKCPHEWDCRSLRANSRQCSTCQVLFSIIRLHFACRLEWSLHNLSRVDDHVHLLSTSNMFRDMLLESDNSENDEDDPKIGHSLELAIWSLWSPFEHPIVGDIHKSAAVTFPLQVKIERSRPCYGIWYRGGTLLLSRWLQNSLAKQPGAMYSQLPDAQIASVPETALPTRVLDLMPDGFIQHIGRQPDSAWSPFVRLAVPQPGTKGRYLTLSHRWGQNATLRLIKANMGQFKEGILLQCLPKTFREAAMIASELGYRYLWIDALCIIQDDPQDWLQESTRMCTVYRNSCCTIAAHTSLGGNSGFIPQSSSSPTLQNKMRALWKGTSSSTSSYASEGYSVLNTRGWVFQERILSKRILHFVHGGAVFFEDASGMFTDETKGIYDPQRKFLPLRSANHPLIHDTKPTLEDVVEKSTQWYRLVERYTRCDLTYDSDRLPAVAGLAKYYQELNESHSGTYLFGLWMNSIHQGLLWVETCPEQSIRIQASEDGNVPQAPSWSWGLWKSPVRYPHHLAACTPATNPNDNPDDPSKRLDQLAAKFKDTKMSQSHLQPIISHPVLLYPQGTNRILTLELAITNWPSGLTARRKPRGITDCPSFPKAPVDSLYNIISLPSSSIRPNWVAFDGRRENLLRYDTELTVALIASNVKVDYFFWVEDEDNVQHKSEEYLYYFLVLERIGGKHDKERKRYKRIGVGAVRRTRWWKEEEGGKVEVVEIE